ncbi:MAG: response regulator [Chloroflexota bacterium]|nr:response regulator [Chloroflexota bacterium]PLS79837.1 MAG: hypothetical protein CYG59_11325 [Chloroflexota bacterium]
MARIVAVDDEPSFLELLQELLGDEGHLVIPVKRGDAAHNVIRRHRPDVVLLDMHLEHAEGGWMILDRMRLDAETAHIPVIICSADRVLLQQHAEHLMEEGSCILEKPFELEALLSTLATALAPDSRACGGV